MRMKLMALLLPILLLATVAEFSFAQTVTSQFRRIRVNAQARDAIFDEDDVIVSDQDVNRNAGQYQQVVDVAANTITGSTTAKSNQLSDIDALGAEFIASGLAQTSSIEDGDSSNSSDSLFRFDFQLDTPGQLLLEDIELEAYRATFDLDPRFEDETRSDDAWVYVRVFDRTVGNERIYNKTIRLQTSGERVEFRDRVDIDLAPGNYRVVIRALVRGDDGANTVQGQPRGSDAYYFVEGRVVENAPAITFDSITQRVSGSYLIADPYYYDYYDSDSDFVESIIFGEAFNEEIDLVSSSTTTIANQSSDVDTDSGVFYAYGTAASGLYIQGSATASTESLFETQFTLPADGSITIEGIIGVSDFLGTFVSRAEPGQASVILEVRDAVGNEVFDDSVFMNGDLPGGIRESEISEVVDLPAGTYSLFIRATANDEAIEEEVGGSIAVGFFELEGSVNFNP
ncbi:MAG: hypothetical protein AAFN77_14235 [Planctomycetota bacterium]